jgi:hypothetical protein
MAMKEATASPSQAVEDIRKIVNNARTKTQAPPVGGTRSWGGVG